MNRLFLALAGAALVGGCDYTGDWLFAGAVPGIPGIYVLEGAGGGPIVPVNINTRAQVDQNAIYAEIGPTGTAAIGGATFTFIGTGGDVCVWVDPEFVFWNQSVSVARPTRRWSYPDNVFDDGDLDLFVGLSVYYTGTPGEVIGNFQVRYEDSLGNDVPISLVECIIPGALYPDGAHAGRGTPEYCTVSGTREGVSYTALLETWSTPLDDDRLGYGVLVANGTCNALMLSLGVEPNSQEEECVIRGEAIMPTEDSYGPYYGYDANRVWPRAIEHETAYCDGSNMRLACLAEAERMLEEGRMCEWTEITDAANRCFCGDPTDTPAPGGL